MSTLRYCVNIDTFDRAKGDADIVRAAALGAKGVRVSVEENFDFSWLTHWRTTCDDNGLLLLNTCQPTGHKTLTGAALTSFANYVADSCNVADYTGVGNEPNLGYATNPSAYADMTMACIAARDTHAANKELVTAEIADINSNGGVGGDPLAWFKAYVNAQPTMLTAGHIGIGWHGYCVPNQDPQTYWPAGHPGWNNCKNIENLYAWLVLQGAGALKIHSWEFGGDGGSGGSAQQKIDMQNYDKEHLHILSLGAKLDTLAWYTLRDHFDVSFPKWGLVFMPPDTQPADSTKPAGDAFTTAAGGSTTDNPPSGSIVLPLNNSTVNGTVTFFVNASDDHTAASAMVVKLFRGATNMGRMTSNPGSLNGFTWTHTLDVDTTDGTWPDASSPYSMTATIDDNVNSPVTTAVVHVTVSNNGTPGIPTITSITPTHGTPDGGTTVIVTGTGFKPGGVPISGANKVRLKPATGSGSAINAASYTVDSDTQITLLTPPQPSGAGSGISFPLWVTYGAGVPTIPATTANGVTSDIDNAVAAGAEGIRFGCDFSNGNRAANYDGHTLTANYMQKLSAVVKYCNNVVLWNGTRGLKVDMQIAIGSDFGAGGGGQQGAAKSGNGYNENSNGTQHNLSFRTNVPKKLAEFGAAVANYFKTGSGNGTVTYYELGNEPNHSKWDNPTDTYHVRFTNVTGGTFKVHGMGGVTAAIPWNVSAATLKTTLVNFYLNLQPDTKADDDINAVTNVTGTPGNWNITSLCHTEIDASGLTGTGKSVAVTRDWDGSGVWKTEKGYAYLKCFAHMKRGVHAADSAAICVIGGLGGHRDSGMDVTAWDFTHDLYETHIPATDGAAPPGFTGDYDGIDIPAAVWATSTNGGIGLYFDHWNYHPYCYSVTPSEDLAQGASKARGWGEMVLLIRPIHARYGTDSKGAIITEFGCPDGKTDPTPGSTLSNEALQIASLQDACINQWGTYDWGGGGGFPLSVFSLADNNDNNGNFGLYHADGTPKTGYVNAYHALATSHTDSPSVATWDIIITNPTGNSETSVSDQFTYSTAAAGPVITSVVPNTQVGTAGGASIVIHGSGFKPGGVDASAVKMGSTPMTSFSVVNDTKINAVVPAKAAGNYHIQVTTTVDTSTATASDQYSYVVAGLPTVTDLDIHTGPIAGGTAVQITGTNFAVGAIVKFGNASATAVVFVSPTVLTCVSPAGAVGDTNVTVQTGAGVSAANPPGSTFTYTNPTNSPTITAMSVHTGAAGSSVVITGTNFKPGGVDASAVKFVGVPSTSFVVNSGTQITATVPAGSGSGNVKVTTTVGTSPANGAATAWSWTAPPGAPTVTGLDTTSGPTAGGTGVLVTGTNFRPGGVDPSDVSVGGVSAIFAFVTDTTLVMITPPGSGVQDVQVTTSVATSIFNRPGDQFTYLAPPGLPTVTSVSPNHGPAAGQGGFTITGTNFKPGGVPATGVLLGGGIITGFTVVNDTTITVPNASVPAGSGVKEVQVINGAGTSVLNPPGDRYTYDSSPAFPTVTSCTPNGGGSNETTPVTIIGTGFVGNVTVAFGTTAGQNVVVQSPTKLTCQAPPTGVRGSVNVVVTNDTGSSVIPSPVTFLYGNNAPVMDLVAIILADGTTTRTPPSGKVSGKITFLIYGQDDSDTTLTNVHVLQGVSHQNDAGTAQPYQFGYFCVVDTKRYSNGPAKFWASGGPDSGGRSGLSQSYTLDIENGGGGGVPPPKK